MSVYLITGSDTVLVAASVSKLTCRLVGDEDRSLILTQLYEDDLRNLEGNWSLAALVGAAQTPPLFTQRRVVVGRHMARFSRASDYGDLLELMQSLLPTTDLVLVWERGVTPAMEGRLPTVPKKLLSAIEAAIKATGGEIVKTDPPMNKRDGDAWVRKAIDDSSLRF